MASFNAGDVIIGITSGASMTILDVYLISGTEAMFDAIYTYVTEDLTGTFILGEELNINGVDTGATISAVPTTGCIGIDTGAF